MIGSCPCAAASHVRPAALTHGRKAHEEHQMLKTFARAAAVAAALLCATAALAQKSFVRDDLASEGVRLEEKLKTEAGSTAAGRPAAQLRRDAEGLMSRANQRGGDEPLRRRDRARAEERRQLGRLRQGRQGDHAQGLHGALPAPGARHGRRLCRLSARHDAPPTRPRRSRSSAMSTHAARTGGRRSTPMRRASARRRCRRAHDL